MKGDFQRILGENHIANNRPVGVIIAVVCLVVVAFSVALLAPVFVLTGLFVGYHVLVIGLGILGLAAVCLVVAAGVYPGYLWAWYGAVLLSLPLVFLTWWLSVGAIFPMWTLLSATVLIFQLGGQLMLWSGQVRKWFFQVHRLRHSNYAGMEAHVDEEGRWRPQFAERVKPGP